MGNFSSDYQPFKYSGKELDRMNGLNAYDYGARMLDAALPVWDRVDPLCEKYYNISPYAYCAGNSVKFVDKDGREPHVIGFFVGGLTEYASQVTANVVEKGFSFESFTNVDYSDIAISAAEGALTCGASAGKKLAIGIAAAAGRAVIDGKDGTLGVSEKIKNNIIDEGIGAIAKAAVGKTKIFNSTSKLPTTGNQVLRKALANSKKPLSVSQKNYIRKNWKKKVENAKLKDERKQDAVSSFISGIIQGIKQCVTN